MTRPTLDPAPSIDPVEVDFYERLADTLWDGSGPFWPLHRLSRLRLDYLRERLATRLGRDPEVEGCLRDLRVLVAVACDRAHGLVRELTQRVADELLLLRNAK